MTRKQMNRERRVRVYNGRGGKQEHEENKKHKRRQRPTSYGAVSGYGISSVFPKVYRGGKEKDLTIMILVDQRYPILHYDTEDTK